MPSLVATTSALAHTQRACARTLFAPIVIGSLSASDAHLPMLGEVGKAEGDGGTDDEQRVKDGEHGENFSECNLK